MAKPSIKDVAKQSGVSYKTVSRVVNGLPDVSDETRRRVEAVVREIGYEPDQAARELRSGRTRTLRLILVRRYERFLTEPFLDEVVAGIVDGAARAGYSLMLEVAGRESDAATHSASGRRVDGTILVDGRSTSPLLPTVSDAGPPWLILPSRPAHEGPSWIYADFRGGARTAVSHLIELGHRRIGHLAGRMNLPERDRLNGYRDALNDASIPIDPNLIVAAGHLHHHGFAAMEKLLARTTDLSAIFAVNDLTALGAIDCLQRRGITVPGQMSVVGFDDIYLAHFSTPPLTTIHLPAYEMGVAAVVKLTSVLERGTTSPVSEEFPVELVIRASTGHPPRD